MHAAASEPTDLRSLEASVAQLMAVTDALPVLVSFVTPDLRYGFVNKAYEEWFGKPRDAVLGLPVVQTIGADALVMMQPYLERALAGERLTFEQRGVPYRDAGTRDVKVYMVPHRDGQGVIDGCVALLEDITERLRLTEESARLVRERTADLKRQAQFEQQLIGIVSHDLRNPLNVIALAAQLLTGSEELGLGKDALAFVVRIGNAADRATHLVRDLLDFTQARLGGGIHLDCQPNNLHELVQRATDEASAAFPRRQVELSAAGDGRGEWDADRLEQIVQNLVTNALKYSPEGSVVRVTTAAFGSASGGSDEVTIIVHNTGSPIRADKLSTLFEPFQRATGATDRTSRSVGVQSTAADGTTFVVKLPRASRQS
jgi:PAS domain S-box-containing protein